MRAKLLVSILLAIFMTQAATAAVYGNVRVIVHDAQHRPIAGATAVLKDTDSAWSQSGITNDEGIAEFSAVPTGAYTMMVSATNFTTAEQSVSALSGRMQELHFTLGLATVQQSVAVVGESAPVNTSTTPQVNITRIEITRTPGADATNSLNLITDVTPGAYVVHDQLHIRGGHQVTWALDGVPLPNTNIASNVGPQFNPKDAAYVEQQRGNFSADQGDRTYGYFNVVPRSGFEMSRAGELVLSYGSFHNTDDQLSFGDHSDRAAYYVSLSGNRSDYGLETPTDARLHDQTSSGSAFSSMQSNVSPRDQIRVVGGFRADHYQVPNDPAAQAAGVRDREREQDGFSLFTYSHVFNPRVLFTISPFFHFNRAAFEGGAQDVPIATDNRASRYAGGQADVSVDTRQHHFKAGIYAFSQRDDHRFSVIANDGSGLAIAQRAKLEADLEAFFVNDQYRPWDWLTLSLGLRATRFSGDVAETSADPRLGVAITVPKVKWVLRASYGRTYQAPPLNTVNGPLLQLALAQGFDFLPLKGERDEEHDFGVTIPLHGWSMELDYFRNAARNFFDHDVLENSNIFFPLTIDHARIRGLELAVRSPHVWKRLNAHLAYSRQVVQGQGAISGGLTDFSAAVSELFFLDHDQRHTFSTGFNADLPKAVWFATNVSAGSGFLDGDGPGHLPAYYSWDVAAGRNFGEDFSLRVAATNITGQRHFIDLSNTFGGSHFSEPRRLEVQVKYRFHF